jgi:hypothetical protein
VKKARQIKTLAREKPPSALAQPPRLRYASRRIWGNKQRGK